MRTRGLPAAVAALTLAVLTPSAAAQPVGDEFQVNTYTTSSQATGGDHLVAADANGNFVVVWNSYGQDGDEQGIFGQRYDAAGNAIGEEFQVNTYTTNQQLRPSVASAASGNFVVVWEGDGADDDIFGQRYDSAGAPLGQEFRVNSATARSEQEPSVACDASGNFVVVWACVGYNYCGIKGQRFDREGMPRGSEFLVNSPPTDFDSFPSVASDARGNFVVVWFDRVSLYVPGFYRILGKRYDSEGVPLGGEFQIDSYLPDYPYGPSVASDASGNFVVVWSTVSREGDHAIRGRRYDSAGVPEGDEFSVASFSTERQRAASVSSDASGAFLVVWERSDDGGRGDGSNDGVFGRHYDSAGNPLTDEFQINSYTTDSQSSPSVGATGSHQFVAVWESWDQDGDWSGVFGQRFDFGAGAITVVSPNGNDIWRIGAIERIRWTHDLGANATFRVELDRDGDGTYDEVLAAEAPVDSATRGYFNWIVTGPRTGTARVRVSWADDPGVADESDATFQIRPAPISAREGLREP